MSWIEEIPYEAAKGKLKKLYDRIKGPDDNVDNIMLAHGLRPHSMEGHMTLYKNVLHHSGNTLPKWYLELLGVYVSHLNACGYCFDHHFAGMSRLLDDAERSEALRQAIEADALEPMMEPLYASGLRYARVLTLQADFVEKEDLDEMREAGLDDGQILEINQVVAYFNYANRMVLGLGITTEGDILGLSPNASDDAQNWSHR